MVTGRLISTTLFLVWVTTSFILASLPLKPLISISKPKIEIGEQAELKITLWVPNPHRIQWPTTSHLPGKVEVIIRDIQMLEADAHNSRWQLTYILTGFEAGEYILAGLPIVVQAGHEADTLLTENLSLQVVTIPNTTKELYDIATIEHITLPWPSYKQLFYHLLLLGVIASGAIALLRIYRLQKKNNHKKVYQNTLKQLNKLEKQILNKRDTLPEGDPCKPITGLLDNYFKYTVGASILKLNKEELAEVMLKNNADKALVTELKNMLHDIEYTRFGRVMPAAEIDDRILERTRRIIYAFHQSIGNNQT